MQSVQEALEPFDAESCSTHFTGEQLKFSADLQQAVPAVGLHPDFASWNIRYLPLEEQDSVPQAKLTCSLKHMYSWTYC